MEHFCRVLECKVLLTTENCSLAYALKSNNYICRKCWNAQKKIKRDSNPEKYRKLEREKRLRLKQSNPEKYWARVRAQESRRKGKRTFSSPKQLEQRRKQRIRLKIEVLTHYCGGLPKCKCGYEDIRALSIDHTNGGGGRHRKELKEIYGHTKIYQWLKNNGYPLGFQVLCMNCQFIKRIENDEFYHPPTVIPGNPIIETTTIRID